jgi:hypothetical protein
MDSPIESLRTVTLFLGRLAGVFQGEPFSARLRYTRTWVYSAENGWRLLAAHVSEASA